MKDEAGLGAIFDNHELSPSQLEDDIGKLHNLKIIYRYLLK